MKTVTIKLKSDLSQEELNKVMEKMLWDSEFSYEFSERVGNIKDFCTKIIRGENRLKEYLDYCQNSGE